MEEKTELEEYQDWVKSTTYGDMHGVELLVMSNALGGECGELQNLVKKIYRDGTGKPTLDQRDHMISELGDIVWYCAAICNTIGMTLDDVIEHNIQKINEKVYGQHKS